MEKEPYENMYKFCLKQLLYVWVYVYDICLLRKVTDWQYSTILTSAFICRHNSNSVTSGASCNWVVSLTFRPLTPSEERAPQNPLDKGLCGLQSPSRRRCKQEFHLPVLSPYSLVTARATRLNSLCCNEWEITRTIRFKRNTDPRYLHTLSPELTVFNK
jgi:hypothetical protein